MRIAVGGFQHETNTFAPSKATFDDFARGGGWPPLLEGDAVFDGTAGINLPITGFVDAMRPRGHTLIPLAWAAASPSAHVTRDAFERIGGLILSRLKAALPVDAVYLDLHGAMVTEHVDDGEGELLSRIRTLVGPDVLIVTSLDLHTNMTAQMLSMADTLVAYRTYPHIDMADTGARAAFLLQRLLDGEPRPKRSLQRLPFLIPLGSQSTMLEPMRSLYASLARLEGNGVDTISFTPGFPAADFSECGPAVFAFGSDPAALERATARFRDEVLAAESALAPDVLSPEEGVRRAMAIAAAGASRPVVIADTQDNPGAGGNSDTTGMLRALVSAGAKRASLGLIADAEVARAAHAVGEGSELTIALGGKSGIPGDAPFEATFTVERLHDGRFTCTGPFYRGARMTIGPSASLRIGDVRVIVACEKPQLADQAMYRFIGIEPTKEAILVNKSSVHFRADFAPIAETILVCKAPGPMLADPADFPWKRLSPGMRVRPNGPVFG